MVRQLKLELANQNKRGISFLFTAALYWLVVAIASKQLDARQTFIVSLWGTGMIFPIGFLVSRIIGANIFYKNDLSQLGMWANIFQLFFFPVFFISAKANIQYPPIFMGILAGAHFIFYFWLFNSRAYLFITFTMVIADYILGFGFLSQSYFVVGLTNAVLLWLTCVLLHFENQKAIANEKSGS